ncbi:MAG TPA: hypothetical protein VKJ01_15145 [Candidatus Solibacter sp.]|nr:hypothetical protein [Candidatus Solibacter sp.]
MTMAAYFRDLSTNQLLERKNRRDHGGSLRRFRFRALSCTHILPFRHAVPAPPGGPHSRKLETPASANDTVLDAPRNIQQVAPAIFRLNDANRRLMLKCRMALPHPLHWSANTIDRIAPNAYACVTA